MEYLDDDDYYSYLRISEKLRTLFLDLPKPLQKKLLSAFADQYCLPEKWFTKLSLEHQKMLTSQGILFWVQDSKCYLPSEELIFAVCDEKSPVYLLISSTKADLELMWKSISPGKSPYRRFEYIQFLLQFYKKQEKEFQKLSEEAIKKMLETVEMVIPILDEYTGEAEQYFFDLYSKESGDTSYFSGGAAFRKYLRTTLTPILATGLIRISDINTSLTLHWSPAVKLHMEAARKRKIESEFDQQVQQLSFLSLLELQKRKWEVSSHLTPRRFLRVFAILHGARAGALIGKTQAGFCRVADLRKLAKKFCALPLEVERMLSLFQFVESFLPDALHLYEGRPFSPYEMEEQELFEWCCRKFERMKRLFEFLTAKVPKEKWITVEEFVPLLESALQREGRRRDGYRTGVSEHELSRFIDVGQFLFGALDVAIGVSASGKSASGKRHASIQALRFIEKREDDLLSGKVRKKDKDTKHFVPLNLQPNFEVVVPQDISFYQLFRVAKIFALENEQTFRFDRATVVHLATLYPELEELLAEIQLVTQREVPDPIKHLCTVVYNERERVYLTYSFLYIYDLNSKSKVDELLSPSLRSTSRWLDGRVLEFRGYDNVRHMSGLKQKLKRENFFVEGD
ncbi:hypothetical protein MRY87_00750 [bacterium]|nr:hypothetical protein [bacterium]